MEGQALKWWQVRWGLAGRIISRFAIVTGKIIGVLCLIAAVGLGIDYLMSPWLVSQRMRKFDPRLSVVPTDLSNKAEAHLSDAALDVYGVSVLLPHEEISKTIRGDSVTVIVFRNGGDVTFLNPSQDSGILGIAINDKNANSGKLVGQETIKSKLKLMQAALWATPDQAKWWRFRGLENQRVEYLLFIKFSMLGESTSFHAVSLGPIYSIATGQFHGFQIGNPDVSPYEVHVDLFDREDRHLALDISGPKGHGQLFTQEEINAMVGSIRPISDQ